MTPTPGTGSGPANPAGSRRPPSALDEIRDRNAIMLWQITARGQAVLDDMAVDRSPASGLADLVAFLREVVLNRISELDGEVFPALRQLRSRQRVVDRLQVDHLKLRRDVEDLAAAASTARGPVGRKRLGLLIDRLVHRLERHLLLEADTLAALQASSGSKGERASDALRWQPRNEGLPA